jgi:hypothetical protein
MPPITVTSAWIFVLESSSAREVEATDVAVRSEFVLVAPTTVLPRAPARPIGAFGPRRNVGGDHELFFVPGAELIGGVRIDELVDAGRIAARGAPDERALRGAPKRSLAERTAELRIPWRRRAPGQEGTAANRVRPSGHRSASSEFGSAARALYAHPAR